MARKQFNKGKVYRQKGSHDLTTHWVTPKETYVYFGREDNEASSVRFDFAPWRSRPISELAALFQWQILLFVETHEGDYTKTTVAQDCYNLKSFLDFLHSYAKSSGTEISPSDLNDAHLTAYEDHLRGKGKSERYRQTLHLAVIKLLRRLRSKGLLPQIRSLKRRLPRGTRPKWGRGQTALSDAERTRVTKALRTEVNSIVSQPDLPLTIHDLATIALAIGLRTGRNTTSIIRLRTDCIRPHFLPNRAFVAFPKPRRNKTGLVPTPSRPEEVGSQHDEFTALPDTIHLIEHLKLRTASLRRGSPKTLSNLLFIATRERHGAPRVDRSNADRRSQILRLTQARLGVSIQAFIEKYDLKSDDGRRLQLSIGRLRKTFSNRVFTLAKGDTLASAAASGHTQEVHETNYLASPPTAKKEWKFMGELMASALSSGDLGDFRTPTGTCASPRDGEYAPKDGSACTAFLQCFRCRSYLVTADDLYKLFSLYHQLVRERSNVGKQAWNRHYSHIIRIIDSEVAARGVAIGVFTIQQVSEARARAAHAPHPYWQPVIRDFSRAIDEDRERIQAGGR